MPDSISTKQMQEYFSGEYVANYPQLPLHRLERLVPYFSLSKIDSVVDYACGSGMLLEVLHGKVGDYTGVDFSPEFIKLATNLAIQKGYARFQFQSGDIIDFAAQHQGQFDKAFAMDFAECLYDHQFLKVFKAVYESLKPGGTLYLHEPNGNFFLERLRDMGIMSRYAQLVAIRTAPRIERLLKEIGFIDIHVQMLSHYETPLSYLHPLSYLACIGKFFEARTFLSARRP